MSRTARFSLFDDSESYTKEQVARLWRHTEDWVEKNVIYPCDSKTKKPLRNPEGEIVLGCPITRVGSEITFLGAQLNWWIGQQSKPQMRSTWLKELEGE